MPGARTAGTAAACDGAAPANTTTTAQATKTQRHRIDLLGVHMISLPLICPCPVVQSGSTSICPPWHERFHALSDGPRAEGLLLSPDVSAPVGPPSAIGRRTQRTAGKAAHRRGARAGRRCHRQTHPADSGQSRTPSRSTNGAQVPSADAPSGQRAKPHTVEEHERGAGAIGRRTQRTAGKAAHRRGARTGRRCHRQTHPADSGQSRRWSHWLEMADFIIACATVE